MHADRTNRSLLTLLGVLLFAAGVAGFLASVGGFGTSFAHRTLFDNRVSRWIGEHGQWLWPLAAVAALIIALLALRWLLALLFSGDRAGDLRIPTEDRSTGRTTLRPGALSYAVAAEIGAYRGVESAKARLIGDATRPDLIVAVTATADTDLAALRQRIETDALTHARQALDAPDLPIQLDLDVTHHTTSRTR